MAIALWIRKRVSSLSSHLLITYLTVMVLVLWSVIGWTGRQLASETMLQARDELELQAQIIANALHEPVARPSQESSSPDARSIPDLLASYAENIGGRATLFDAQLHVIASSDSQIALAAVENSPEFSSVRYDIRRDAPSSGERLYVAAPIPSGVSHPLGFVQLSVPMAPIYAAINRQWLDLIAIGAIAVAVTILASLLLARRVVTPVQRLTATSEQIASGRLDVRVGPAGPSEVRRLGDAFNRMAERVQAMIARQREFVDNAAHELRSPLTSLRLRLDLLADDDGNDRTLTRQYIGKMQHDVGYLQHLTEHLLTLASVEAGEPVERTPVDLGTGLRDLAEDMTLIVRQAQLTFDIAVPEHLPAVRVNADQIRIAVRNLLDNAAKYTRPGGTISLLVRSDEHALEVHVCDTGIGIPPEALPHIFERFYRADRARARKQGGAGLGLALVRAMVEANDGSVSVKSRVNEGSEFTIRLPIVRAGDEQAQS